MKPVPKPRSVLVCSASILIACGIAESARAAVSAVATQSGVNVMIVASGSFDTTGLDTAMIGYITENIEPANSATVMGTSGPDVGKAYFMPTSFAGPASYGPGAARDADSGFGDVFGIGHGVEHFLMVEADYVSGSPLSATMTFSNETIAGLGMTEGVYTWTWNWTHETVPHQDSLTLTVTPEPTSAIFLALGMLTALVRRRR